MPPQVSGVIRFFKLAVSPGALITGELVSMAEELYIDWLTKLIRRADKLPQKPKKLFQL